MNIKIKNFTPEYIIEIKNIFENHLDFVYLKNKVGQLVYFNKTFKKKLKLSNKFQDTQRTIMSKAHLEINRIDKSIIREGISRDNLIEDYYFKNPKHKRIIFLSCKTPILNKKKEILGLLNISKDITTLKEESEKNYYFAKQDSLTGFLNKRAFIKCATEEIERSSRNKSKLVFLYIDLDKFKKINDTYGHVQGDKFLVGISKRIKNNLRKTDLTCRFGGDEFIILITSLNSKDHISLIISNLKKIISKPLSISKFKKLNPSVSIGYSIYPDDSKKLISLINKADLNMYKEK